MSAQHIIVREPTPTISQIPLAAGQIARSTPRTSIFSRLTRVFAVRVKPRKAHLPEGECESNRELAR